MSDEQLGSTIYRAGPILSRDGEGGGDGMARRSGMEKKIGAQTTAATTRATMASGCMGRALDSILENRLECLLVRYRHMLPSAPVPQEESNESFPFDSNPPDSQA